MSINLAEDIKPISYIKSRAAAVLDYVNENKRPVIVTQHGEARAVFLDIETYQSMLDSMAMMRLVQFAEDAIRHNEVTAHDAVFKDLREKLNDETAA